MGGEGGCLANQNQIKGPWEAGPIRKVRSGLSGRGIGGLVGGPDHSKVRQGALRNEQPTQGLGLSGGSTIKIWGR